MPQVRPPQPPPAAGERRARNETWSPWTSLGAGLLLAAGVICAVTIARRRRQREENQLEPPGDDQLPGG